MSCAKCQNPLTLEVDYSDDEDVSMGAGSSSAAAQNTQTVPDDVALNCGCHFHWYVQLLCVQVSKLSNHNIGNV